MRFAQRIQVFVRIKGVHLKLDHGDGNVGAMVRNALQVGEKIVEHEALRQGAVAGLNALHVMQLHQLGQLLYLVKICHLYI